MNNQYDLLKELRAICLDTTYHDYIEKGLIEYGIENHITLCFYEFSKYSFELYLPILIEDLINFKLACNDEKLLSRISSLKLDLLNKKYQYNNKATYKG